MSRQLELSLNVQLSTIQSREVDVDFINQRKRLMYYKKKQAKEKLVELTSQFYSQLNIINNERQKKNG